MLDGFDRLVRSTPSTATLVFICQHECDYTGILPLKSFQRHMCVVSFVLANRHKSGSRHFLTCAFLWSCIDKLLTDQIWVRPCGHVQSCWGQGAPE